MKLRPYMVWDAPWWVSLAAYLFLTGVFVWLYLHKGSHRPEYLVAAAYCAIVGVIVAAWRYFRRSK